MAARVFVFEDNKERVESLQLLISLHEGLQYVGAAYDCSNAVQDVANAQPNVVLMDINMPNVNGIEGLKAIKEKFPAIKVLIQTAFDDSEKVFTSITHGASGYILKNDAPERLIQAIWEVNEGGASMNPAIAQRVLDYFKPNKTESPLTAREQEVLALLSQGLSYKLIADKLAVSYATVNTHIKRIYDKLHISSMGEAIAYYYNNLR
jgi:DNA-binding NarL/FixJ family response regulator